MKVNEILFDEDVIDYINDKRITSNDNFTISDVIRIIRNNPEKMYLLTKYITFRRENPLTKIIEKDNDDLFINACGEINAYEGKTSIWNHIKKQREGKYTYEKVLKSYLKKLSENDKLEKDIYKTTISIFRLQKNIYKDLIFLDIIGKVNLAKILDYNSFMKMITNNNNYLYLNMWLSENYVKHLNNQNIKRIGDLRKYLDVKTYNKEYSELYGLLPVLKETSRNNIPCDFTIDKYINSCTNKNDNIIFMLKVKNTKTNIIKKIIDTTYKKIVKSYEEVLVKFQSFFDSFEGRYIIKYILSIKNGYFSEKDLKKIFPKYYIVIEYLIKKQHIYNVTYNDVYDIYTYKDIPSDTLTLNKYPKYLNSEQYQRLINELKTNTKGIEEEVIIKRINKDYKKYEYFYAKGYVSVEYKICFLYNKTFSQGFKDIKVFVKEYNHIYKENAQIENILYVYFFKINGIYLLKPQYQEKYFGLVVNYEYASKEEINLVYMVCEGYRISFSLDNIVKDLQNYICERKIKIILKHSLLYYQLKNNTYIKSDCLKITDEMRKYFFLISCMTKKTMFEKVQERYNDFLKYYKIKNACYLFQIVKKITKKIH